MLLIHGDQKRWAEVDDATMKSVLDEYFALDDALTAAGAFVDSAPLAPPGATKTVAPDGAVTDGPFAETSEQLGGYYVIDVADEAAAVGWAKQVPGLRRGLDHVEVRAIVEVERT
jgi:hypothetical protein